MIHYLTLQWKYGIKTIHDPDKSALNTEVVLIVKQNRNSYYLLLLNTLDCGVLVLFACLCRNIGSVGQCLPQSCRSFAVTFRHMLVSLIYCAHVSCYMHAKCILSVNKFEAMFFEFPRRLGMLTHIAISLPRVANLQQTIR